MSDPFQNEYGETSSSRALCALHPETPALSSCARCGNFMCQACTGGQEGLCPACREQAGLHGFPFHRNAWTFSGLWEHSAALFKPQWLQLSLSALIVLGVSLFGSSISQGIATGLATGAGIGEVGSVVLLLVFSIFGAVVQAGMSLGFMRVCLDVMEGRQVDHMRLFTQFGRVPQVLIASILAFAMLAVVVALGVGAAVLLFKISPWMGAPFSVALVIALIGICSPLYLLPAAMVVDPKLDGITALQQLWNNASGQRLSILGVMLVSGLLMIGGMMLCGVGFIPAYAFSQLLFLALYLAISRPDPAALA